METKKHGGARKGAGRPSKVDEDKTNNILLKAIKNVFSKENDEDARVAMAEDLLTFERGKMFIAEHIFGKPKEIKDINITDIKPLFLLKEEE